MIPLGIVVGVGMFLGIGTLVAWLWKVTVADIFSIKPISFWQAWGLILLAQIFFKANAEPTMRTGRRRRRLHPRETAPAPPLSPP